MNEPAAFLRVRRVVGRRWASSTCVGWRCCEGSAHAPMRLANGTHDAQRRQQRTRPSLTFLLTPQWPPSRRPSSPTSRKLIGFLKSGWLVISVVFYALLGKLNPVEMALARAEAEAQTSAAELRRVEEQLAEQVIAEGVDSHAPPPHPRLRACPALLRLPRARVHARARTVARTHRSVCALAHTQARLPACVRARTSTCGCSRAARSHVSTHLPTHVLLR
eukprot:4879123-Pleurochrysis_carterae.AAC.2